MIELPSSTSKPLIAFFSAVLVVVVLLGSVLIPTITDPPTAENFNDYDLSNLGADQYYPIYGLSDASGSVEIVEYGGKSYLHTIDIGPGQVTINGIKKDVNVNKTTLNVFLLTGQSQSVYREANISIANENKPIRCGQAFYYGGESNPITYSSTWAEYDWASFGLHPMNDIDGLFRIGSLEAPLASTFVNSTGESILIINTGINGRSISSFYGGNDAELYGEKIITSALALIDTDLYDVKLNGWFWLHGQADKNDEPATYLEKFANVRAIYAEYGFYDCMIELPRAVEAPKIVRADYLIAETYADCYVASVKGQKFATVGPYIDDGTHYNQYGRNIVGTELMDYYLYEVNPELLPDHNDSMDLLLVAVPIIISSIILAAVGIFIKSRY